MTSANDTYSYLNNAVLVGLELVVAQHEMQKTVRAVLVPAGKGHVFRDLVLKEGFGEDGTSPLFNWLLAAQWFPIAIEYTLQLSLDALEKRLMCLEPGFAFADEESTEEKKAQIWKKSIDNVCQKLESATLPVGRY